jgi:uncharacterized membrane protein YoaK (UPF0700 family)
MNAPFKPVSAVEWLVGFNNGRRRNGPSSGSNPGQLTMLILLVAITILGSLVVEMISRHFKNTYEIVWPVAPVVPENAMALEIAASLRRVAANLNGK